MPAGNGYWSRWFLQGGFCRKIQRRRPQPMCNKEVNVVHGHCPCRACNSPSPLLHGCTFTLTQENVTYCDQGSRIKTLLLMQQKNCSLLEFSRLL